MTRALLFATAVAVVGLWTGSTAEVAPTPTIDHHIHIPTEATAEYIREAVGIDLEATTGTDVIRFLDEAGIENGVLLSLAYMFGRPDAEFSNEYARVKQENDYVACQAAAYPERLIAFCSVNPLAEYATKEIERCAQVAPVEGLKLQLANSNVDLRDTTDIRRLAGVFAQANRHDLAIAVHLWTGSDYGRKDVEIFLHEVLPEAPGVPVQVAHMGGAGMFSETTVEAMNAFEDALENKPALMENVYFDLGAVTEDPEFALAEEDTARAQQYRTTHRRTARWIQRIGPDRVVFASDYFARKVPEYVETLRGLPLPDSTLWAVFDNTVPYVD